MRDARFVGPHERLLYLRSLPQAPFLDADAYAAFALALRERWFRRGALLAREDELPRAVHFVVDGAVTARKDGLELLRVEPPFGVGFLSVLSEQPLELRAEEDTLTLQLRAEDLLTFLEDHFLFLRNAFRLTGKSIAELQEELELLGVMDRAAPAPGVLPADPLDLVQRLEVLTQGGPFGEAALDAVVELARGADEVRLAPGDVLWREGDAATFGMHLVGGEIRCVGRDGKLDFGLGAGDVIGHLDAFAETPRRYDAVAETAVVGLRTDTERFFDVLEDNFGLARSFLGFMNRTLISLHVRRAQWVRATAPPPAGPTEGMSLSTR